MKPVIASTLALLSAFALQAPEALSQSNETLSLKTHQSTLIAGRSNRRLPRPVLGGGTKIQAPLSVIGNWSGSMRHKPDDVLTYIELKIPSGGGAIKYGTWNHIGQSGQGSATIQKQGNQVSITFQNFYGKTLSLQGSFKDGGQTISGHEVNNPSYVFSFSK